MEGEKKKNRIFPSGVIKGESSAPALLMGPGSGTGSWKEGSCRTGGAWSWTGSNYTVLGGMAASRSISGCPGVGVAATNDAKTENSRITNSRRKVFFMLIMPHKKNEIRPGTFVLNPDRLPSIDPTTNPAWKLRSHIWKPGWNTNSHRPRSAIDQVHAERSVFASGTLRIINRLNPARRAAARKRAV